MSTWDGEHGKGAMRARREEKREQAEARHAATPPERRSTKRQPAQVLSLPRDGSDG